MEVIVCANAAEVGRIAGAKVAAVLTAARAQGAGRAPVLGVATGSSPLALYADLRARVERGELDLSGVSAFALDEYIGLPQGHPESYAEVIRTTVTEPLGLDPQRVHTPDGFATDLQGAAEEYERLIAEAGGVDVQILGVGGNGHIGFNEPGSSLASRTRIKTLAGRTRADNARFFGGDLDAVPRHCLTQGLGTILDAREAVLVAQGGAKSDAVRALVEGPVTASVPGSVLQLHPHATVIVDEDAASGLAQAEYYREAYRHKPQWQRFDRD